ncbi:hypothetical protein DICSQDRAFT_141879 [Dichomitus squalens LYAD-421 SS1]|uniref:Secreted protein n=1 Tax=Dichomitus squalens (strain LYAD-421) TaxID=732165 RepID=R7SKT9_DICSQ|nr:uncharacterized protein DICSQDRAFT_141879 [Dichomitus squalens LYAD-421 SS1]EJF55652.1 hypothetical protein DICSQDRAFT_141879 [Dichomitus squalens LYAD-421 SS1]
MCTLSGCSALWPIAALSAQLEDCVHRNSHHSSQELVFLFACRKPRFYFCTNAAACTSHVKGLADPSY